MVLLVKLQSIQNLTKPVWKDMVINTKEDRVMFKNPFVTIGGIIVLIIIGAIIFTFIDVIKSAF